MRGVADELVLTTPNAYRLLNFLAPLSGSELVHPDHTAWHSPATLRRLCEDAGWEVTRIAYYHTPVHRKGGGLANVARFLLRRVNSVVPYWSDGLIVWARLGR